MDEKRRMTIPVSEMANELSISQGTAYRLANNPDFYPALRLGKRIVISTESLERWIQEHTNGDVAAA